MYIHTPTAEMATGLCRKRILGDLRKLKNDPLQFIDVFPEENLLTWIFLIKGPPDTMYKGGHYMGKIVLSPEYPMKPPEFYMLTPSGRFRTNSKICMTNSNYHSEQWTAMWTVHAMLLGLLSIMLDTKESGISHTHETADVCARYARESIDYNKNNHMSYVKRFTRFLDADGNPKEDTVYAATQQLQKEERERKEQEKKAKEERDAAAVAAETVDCESPETAPTQLDPKIETFLQKYETVKLSSFDPTLYEWPEDDAEEEQIMTMYNELMSLRGVRQ